MKPPAACLLVVLAALVPAPDRAAPDRAAAAVSVTFDSKTIAGAPITLGASLATPNGRGPFPAVILMHGCSGLRGWGEMWADRLVGWGYAAFRPDSFGARGIADCAQGNATVDLRAEDARAAARYLRGRNDIDGNRMAVLGMSHGATAALIAVGVKRSDADKPGIFKAAIALYPRCYQADAEAVNAAAMVLIGEADHLAPAGPCSTLSTRGSKRHPLVVNVYPGATHGFDWERLDVTYFGQRIRYDAEAATDAVPRIRKFLEKYLNKR